MLINDFNHTIDIWIKELDRYHFDQLLAKPAPASWSAGQMYLHLIADTHYYIDQIKICLSKSDHAMEEASAAAKRMFLNNDFPDEALEGAHDNAFIPQPESKEQLIKELIHVKTEMNNVAAMISKSMFKGKAKHPGFNYFGAHEWLQFAEMHFRHHLIQKRRIDSFLRTNK